MSFGNVSLHSRSQSVIQIEEQKQHSNHNSQQLVQNDRESSGFNRLRKLRVITTN